MMKTPGTLLALAGIVALGGCWSADHAERLDTSHITTTLVATQNGRELGQSLAAVSMMNDLRPGESLALSGHARAIISAYAE